jgi:hypothetical protein
MEVNVKIVLNDIEWDNVDLIQLALDRKHWLAVMNTGSTKLW